MKQLIKKTALVTMLGLSASAMANEASGMFQWVGTVPASDSSAGTWEIVNKGPINFDSGSMIFQESATPGEYNLTSASNLLIDVVDSATDTSATSYSYQIESVRFSSGGGLMSSVNLSDPEFNVTVDGVKRDVVDTAVEVTTGISEISLMAEDPLTGFDAGDEIVVQAVVLITEAS